MADIPFNPMDISLALELRTAWRNVRERRCPEGRRQQISKLRKYYRGKLRLEFNGQEKKGRSRVFSNEITLEKESDLIYRGPVR